MPCIVLENLLRSHFANGHRHAGIHQVDDAAAPDEVHQRNDHEPHQQGSAADDEGILEADDVAEAQHGRAGIEFQDEFRLVGNRRTPAHHRGGNGLRPCAEGRDAEVVQSADEAGRNERLRRRTAAFPAHEDLRRGRRLRERILPVHFLHEILPERDEEQDAQHAAQQRAQEHLPEIDLHPEDIDGRQREDGARHDGAGAAADGLDDHVLRQAVLFLERSGQAHGDDGDRNRRLEHLPDLQAQVGRRRREQHHHQNADAHRIRRNLGITLRRIQDWLVFLTGLQLPLRVLRQGNRFFLFHR